MPCDVGIILHFIAAKHFQKDRQGADAMRSEFLKQIQCLEKSLNELEKQHLSQLLDLVKLKKKSNPGFVLQRDNSSVHEKLLNEP